MYCEIECVNDALFHWCYRYSRFVAFMVSIARYYIAEDQIYFIYHRRRRYIIMCVCVLSE